jgi:hypothetical protein
LEGFGASLLGRAIYVCADAEHAWIPWEFLEQPYSKVLITGDGSGFHTIEASVSWTAIFRPTQAKDWSAIATVLRGIGQHILLVFDTYAPAATPNFYSYLDGLLKERCITRIWIGNHELPVIPDAIFFPVLRDADIEHAVSILGRLPARANHGPFTITHSWPALVKATQESNLGIVVSDVEERSWSLFWHKVSDSPIPDCAVRGRMWIKAGLALLEKNTEA